jgi:hypothetical protein
MRQLLCLKSKFPNHFAFTLGRYLFMLFLVQFIGSVRRIETMHQLLRLKSEFPNHVAFTLGHLLVLAILGTMDLMWMLTIVVLSQPSLTPLN